MERLWSYLRSFSKITKEMTPAHRVDFLSDSLNHFTKTKLENLGIRYTYDIKTLYYVFFIMHQVIQLYLENKCLCEKKN